MWHSKTHTLVRKKSIVKEKISVIVYTKYLINIRR